MARYLKTQNNFKAGEIGGVALGDVSNKDYERGLVHLENAFTLRSGGVHRRPGTQFVKKLESHG